MYGKKLIKLNRELLRSIQNYKTHYLKKCFELLNIVYLLLYFSLVGKLHFFKLFR